MRYQEALAYLSQYTNYERELRYPYDGWAMNLERVRVLLEEMGNPDRGLAAVHIAGTKGKGSTAAMIEAMARAAGYRTGLFTSPHLLDFRERIRLDGEPAAEEAVARAVERLIPAAAKVREGPPLGPLTYFEILTALAFAIFAEAKVGLAVLETGLGGRFDATNVCTPVCAVLTPVSYDHMDILGDTLEAIAGEKAMIIKPGAPAVISPQSPAAAAVFHRRCSETGAPEIKVEEVWRWRRVREDLSGQWLEFEGPRRLFELFLPLLGDHQAVNAATAITTMDVLAANGFPISDEAMRAGLGRVVWPGRFERVRERPTVILDGAHNAASAAALRETVLRLYPGRRVIAVMGLGRDKDVEGFCRELGPALAVAVLTGSSALKAVPPERIRAALAAFPVRILEAPGVAAALDLALAAAGPEDVILVTGSFYVVAEAMAGKWRG